MSIRIIICGACEAMATAHWLNCPACGALKLEMVNGDVRPINGAKAIDAEYCERCGSLCDTAQGKCQTCGNKVVKQVDKSN